MTIKTAKYILPVDWASYLMYGDEDFLQQEEIESIARFMDQYNLFDCVDCSEDVWFQWANDAKLEGGTVTEYTFTLREQS
jgi:hypothetical protein